MLQGWQLFLVWLRFVDFFALFWQLVFIDILLFAFNDADTLLFCPLTLLDGFL